MSTSLTAPRPERPLGSGDLVRAALVVVATLVGLQLLWSARLLILTAFLGILFGLSAARAVDAIVARVKVKRSIAAVGVVGGVVLALALFATLSGPTFVEQSQELRTKLPEAVGKVETWLATSQPQLLEFIAPTDSSGGRLVGLVTSNAPKLTDFVFGVLQSTVVVAGAMILIVFLAIYIAADPDVYRRGTLLLIPLERREQIADLMRAIGGTLRTWFATQLIAMLVIGVVTTVALAIIGVPAALPLGVLAGLFEFVPNVGPLLAGLPAVLMGFVNSPQQALLVAGVYWAIQFLENNLLIPYLMSEQLDLPPALTLVTQVIMAYVFGFLGLFVAIPLLATAVVTVRTLWVDEDLPPLPTVELPMSLGSEL